MAKPADEYAFHVAELAHQLLKDAGQRIKDMSRDESISRLNQLACEALVAAAKAFLDRGVDRSEFLAAIAAFGPLSGLSR